MPNPPQQTGFWFQPKAVFPSTSCPLASTRAILLALLYSAASGYWFRLLIYIIGSRAHNKGHFHVSVDIKRYQLLRKMSLLFALVSALSILLAWRAPTLAFLYYLLMTIGGITAGFFVKMLEK